MEMLESATCGQIEIEMHDGELSLLEKAFRDCEHRLGRPATNLEVCNELGVSLKELYSLLDSQRGVSLGRVDEREGNDPSVSVEPLLKYVPDPDNEEYFYLYPSARFQSAMAQALEALPKNEKLVVSLHHNEDMTMRDIAEIFGVSEARIAQIHTTAVLRIRGKLLALEAAFS
jgi:RNA polymerase sigma factor FliA